MSRQSQDIPIRPRYGVMAENEDLGINERQRSSSGAQAISTSSYSEIPFLAQYAGAVPKNTEQTPTDESSNNDKKRSEYREPQEPDDAIVGNVEDDNDDDDDEDNSKDSLKDADDIEKQQRQSYDESFPYELESTTSDDGEIRHFTAKNRAKDQHNSTRHNSTVSSSIMGNSLTRNFMETPLPQIDANVLSDIELEAQYLAGSVDNLLDNLTNLLHSISSITADNVEVHRCAVNKLTDSMDANIKCMYTIMAKTEEITKSMKPTEKLGQRIREIKRLVEVLEASI